MKLHPQPAAPTTPLVVQIAPGQILWTCLAPGSILHTTQGEVAIRFVPHICGHATHAHPQAVLKAGTKWPLMEHQQASWVQLGCATHNPAEVKIVEGTPKPGLRQKAGKFLRMIFADRAKALRNGTHGAWHAAQ